MDNRPDPRLHQRADMYQLPDELDLPRRHDPDRLWWGIVGLFSIVPLWMLARLLDAGAAGAP